MFPVSTLLVQACRSLTAHGFQIRGAQALFSIVFQPLWKDAVLRIPRLTWKRRVPVMRSVQHTNPSKPMSTTLSCRHDMLPKEHHSETLISC